MIPTHTEAACLKSAMADIRNSDPTLFDRSFAHGLLEGRVRTALSQLKVGNAMGAENTLRNALGDNA